MSLTFSPSYALKNTAAIGRIIAIGLLNATSSSLAGVVNAFANQFLVQYGNVAVAAMAAVGKSTMIILMIQMDLCLGVQPLLAYNYGAANLKRLKEILVKLTGKRPLLGASIISSGSGFPLYLLKIRHFQSHSPDKILLGFCFHLCYKRNEFFRPSLSSGQVMSSFQCLQVFQPHLWGYHTWKITVLDKSDIHQKPCRSAVSISKRMNLHKVAMEFRCVDYRMHGMFFLFDP